jgi:uncharacterized membrane protein (DUF485 family)
VAHFDHKPQASDEPHDPVQDAKRARLGVILFAIYCALYGGFMLINVFAPSWMESTPFGGVNLAILYGFSLIVGALVLALFYAWMCREPM